MVSSKNLTRAALISVSDKTGVVSFARELHELGFTLLSTGGTARELQDHGLPTMDIATYTEFPEILDGRVKTLHPKVHAGILYDRDNAAHVVTAREVGVFDIAVVCVNLYPFEKEAVAKQRPLHEAIEYIDIGGPTLLRAAAKNHRHVFPIMDPKDYPRVISALRENNPAQKLREELSASTFAALATYNALISSYIGHPTTMHPGKSTELRYGENPHQRAYLQEEPSGCFHSGGNIAKGEILQGKELSYNNYLDMDAAYRLVNDFNEPTLAIIKHTNPCGFATGFTSEELYNKALSCDAKSAFGGIVATNIEVTEEMAKAMSQTFLECIVAPEFSPGACDIFKNKTNLRLFRLPMEKKPKESWEMRSLSGTMLMQEMDTRVCQDQDLQFVTSTPVTDQTRRDLVSAFRVVKHVKSNAIVLFRKSCILGIGAGQMSRIDALELAIKKAKEAGHDLTGSTLASDAFFPFRDCVDLAAKHGITAIIQPGGSKRDDESIAAAMEHGMAMAFTGFRHFRH